MDSILTAWKGNVLVFDETVVTDKNTRFRDD